MIPDMYLILFMLIFNSVPGMVNGALDQLITVDKLERRPALFVNSSKNKLFKPRVFWITLFDSGEFFFELKILKKSETKIFTKTFSVWQSLVQFYVPYFAFQQIGETYQGLGLESGSSVSMYVFGTVVAEVSLVRYSN